MILKKAQYWNQLVAHYYDNVHWEEGYAGIYEWLEDKYNIVSNTESTVLKCRDHKKATLFLLKWT